MKSPELAVIIPAYRSRYLKDALDSLANQTDRRFSVYIGDDCSPENLAEIAAPYHSKLDISYTRFDNNIGAKNLVMQWNRCIALARGASWLWVFSDDDLADPQCVECFFRCLQETNNRFDVYRFNTLVIDKDSRLIFSSPIGPLEESSAAMAYHLLRGERGNSMPDHIFRASGVEQNGGFIYTEFAQAADWASSIFFSRRTGIRIIDGAKVHWRMSGQNISSIARLNNDMVVGHFRFLEWLGTHLQYLSSEESEISYEMLRTAALSNFRSIVTDHYGGLRLRNNGKAYRLLRRTFLLSRIEALTELLSLYVKNSPRIKRFYVKARALVTPVP